MPKRGIDRDRAPLKEDAMRVEDIEIKNGLFIPMSDSLREIHN